MYILGISAFYHDSAVAILKNGEILFAAQEERYSRIKHDAHFPEKALAAALDYLDITPDQIKAVVFYEKPFLKFERLLETYLAFAPKGLLSFLKAMPAWIKEKLFQKNIISKKLIDLGFDKNISSRIFFSDHHLSHAASAFYPSPFDKALVLTMDGVGEWPTTTVYLGDRNELRKVKEIHFPHSLGLFYSAFTYYCGFKVNSGEYKLMGLAPYGQPRFVDLIKQHLISIKEDGSFALNLDYFDFPVGLKMTNAKFNQLFDFSFRKSEDKLLQIHMDIAASAQVVLEEVILKMTKSLQNEFPDYSNIVLAGGVALNCVANSKILKQGLYKDIWIQPAAGDAGGAIGAAYVYFYESMLDAVKPKIELGYQDDLMKGSYLGNSYSDEEISDILTELGAAFHDFRQNRDSKTNLQQHLESKQSLNSQHNPELINLVVEALVENKAIGWFQDRMEFGPRALGSRSILASPLDLDMQKKLNLKIKFRESFRPFAPAVLEDHASDWFDCPKTSPYMLLVSQVTPVNEAELAKHKMPAITHVDNSARLQTVSKITNPKFYNLIHAFYQKTGVPVLVNTSFNIRGEPIVESPYDAYRCFMGTDLDLLVIGSYLLYKDEQSPQLRHHYKQNYQNQFQKD